MIILLLLEGFFSGSEIALVHADKIKLHARASQGHKGSRMVLQFFQRPDIMLTTTLVGTNISIVVLTTLGTLLMIGWFGNLGEVYAVLIFTPLFLTFGEVVPKSVYQQNADQLAPIVVYPLRIFKILLYPVIFFFSMVARLAAKLGGARASEKNLFITRQQIRTVVDMANRGAGLGMFDQDRIRRAIRFADTTVGEAMVPLAEIIALNRQSDIQRIISLIRTHGYNRLPVYEGNIGNITGIVTLTVWDLMGSELASKSLSDLIQAPLYVSPLQKIDDLLPELSERNDHMAIVVDEFGSAVGMITIEDILEEVVGEISVGYDFDEFRPRRKRQYKKLGEDAYLVDSRVPISEINELLELDLPATEFHTIGGFIETRLRHIPATGEFVDESGWRFTIEEASERAIRKIYVERK
jgi:CBS domain containing-hemolysin-like protein